MFTIERCRDAWCALKGQTPTTIRQWNDARPAKEADTDRKRKKNGRGRRRASADKPNYITGRDFCLEQAAQSIIEAMAADFYEVWKQDGKVLVGWHDLRPDDRRRFIDAMFEAVKRVPERCDVKQGHGTSTIILGEGRQAILDDHKERWR